MIEKFEEYSALIDVAIVLLTADDVGSLADGERMSLRARQNAIFELGYFAGLLGRKSGKVVVLVEGELELPYPYSWSPDSKAVIFVSDRDGPFHIFKQAIEQTQPELLVGGEDDLTISRLTPDGTAVIYLVMPKGDDPSHGVRITQTPLAGGPPKLVLQAPWIWNQQCARLPSTLCIYSPNEAN